MRSTWLQNNIFLLDGCGALLTVVSISAILAPFEVYFGMPRPVLYLLSAIAAVYAVYSLVCHVYKPKNKSLYLRIIAVANALYCVLTLGLVCYYYEKLTFLCIAYFLGECLIIAALVYIELGIASRGKEQL